MLCVVMATKTLEPVSVLLIDDDVELATLLGELMRREGVAFDYASNGRAGLAALDSGPALVLLDLMLPDIGGIEVFRLLRARAPLLPVIMLTARGDPVDRVVGLELGADDYIAKPFDPRELLARVRAVLRRGARGAEVPSGVPAHWRLGEATIDLAARTIVYAGREVVFSNLEFKMLTALAAKPGQAVSRVALTRAVQQGNYEPLDRAVDVQISRLRRKLRALDAKARWIVTARGEGYVWSPPTAGGQSREPA